MKSLGEDSEDAGVATVLAAFALLAILTVVIMMVNVGGAVGARHQAQSAADLSALAAANTLDRGDVEACEEAEATASRMGVEVRGCVVEDWDVVVTVARAVPLGRFGMPDAVAVARAGP